MAEHTAGPWRTGQGLADVIFVGTGRQTRQIAHVNDLGDYEQELANAKLIASAPDLLAACEQLLPVARQYLLPVYGNALEVAIAKAKGGAQ